LRDARLRRLILIAFALLPRLLATAEQVVEEPAGGTLLLRHGDAGEQRQGKRGERRNANSVS
jgi:hypothetical protein